MSSILLLDFYASHGLDIRVSIRGHQTEVPPEEMLSDPTNKPGGKLGQIVGQDTGQT